MPVLASALLSEKLARSRRVVWAGIGILVLGVVWDGVWHSRNPQALETGWRLLQAHGVMYAGILVALAGSLWPFAGPPRPSASSWYAATAAGALALAVGRGWDALAHARGGEVAGAHLLARLGLVLVLSGAIGASWAARRSQASPEA